MPNRLQIVLLAVFLITQVHATYRSSRWKYTPARIQNKYRGSRRRNESSRLRENHHNPQNNQQIKRVEKKVDETRNMALDLLVWKQRHTRYMRDIDIKVQKIEKQEKRRAKQPKIDPNTAYIAYSMAKYMLGEHDENHLSPDEAEFIAAVNTMKLTRNKDGQSELIIPFQAKTKTRRCDSKLKELVFRLAMFQFNRQSDAEFDEMQNKEALTNLVDSLRLQRQNRNEY